MSENLNRQKFIKMTEEPVEKLICKMSMIQAFAFALPGCVKVRKGMPADLLPQ